SEASNTRAGRGSMAGHSGMTLRRHSLANQKPGMHGGAFRSANTAEHKQPCCSVWFGQAEPERQGHATKQAELSMQATEPSPSGPSARFARFDSRPGWHQVECILDSTRRCRSVHISPGLGQDIEKPYLNRSVDRPPLRCR